MRKPDLIWATYLVAVALGFTVLERQALRNPQHGHTLTATTRRWLGLHPVQPWRSAGYVGFAGSVAGGTGWLIYHILIEGSDIRGDQEV
ncbi:hypothetical protein [Saccharopolyspora mangrovi]|uniref:Uncharacterized protein n=1 Tax=Saccharopolyspora mangrovi TaxID=3082379 RepID=A0ABU6A7D3_9PSEU|nr:hypothetical protein [Saccharopolyspora sp. S2-29]MEB3367399.1 hypothetical protein [Saccharopolyspora sp. S2-29]